MKEPSTSVGSAPVPAFLMKLWALVEDPSNNDVISWSWNGQNFCILDEQRFSKEILPKYFKHNNLSSFIRQLNMYGFRKVMSLESGLLRSDRSSCIEFQHPFFKKGKSELLENIKRKMSSVKSEEPHLTPEELQKVITELQDLKDVQSNLDTKLENMRRENEALWKEVSVLRRRHCQQQKLLSKLPGTPPNLVWSWWRWLGSKKWEDAVKLTVTHADQSTPSKRVLLILPEVFENRQFSECI